MDLVKYKQEIKKIRNVDVYHPSYPAYRKKVMDMAETINFIVVEILKKENGFSPD